MLHPWKCVFSPLSRHFASHLTLICVHPITCHHRSRDRYCADCSPQPMVVTSWITLCVMNRGHHMSNMDDRDSYMQVRSRESRAGLVKIIPRLPSHSTAALHRHTPPPHSTAALHCHTPPPHSTAALHRCTPLPHSTATLHCCSSRHPPSHARFSSPFGLHLLEIPIVRGFASSEYRMALSVAVAAAAKVVQEGGQGRTVAHRRLPPRGPGCVQRQVGACRSRLSIVHLRCRAASPRSDVYYL
jgi:hypothetical protein